MSKIKITKKPKLNNPYFLAAWPGMGDVAFKAASYLVEKLGAKEFADMPAEDFLYINGSIIEDGILELPAPPVNKFYYWKNPKGNDLIIFVSDAQPDLMYYHEYCESILSVVKGYAIKEIICFAALPVPIDHTEEPQVMSCATDKTLNDELTKYDVKNITIGQISGMNGLFLAFAKTHGYRGFCLLSEIPIYTIQLENPKASAAILNALGKILNIPLDVRELKDQAHTIEEQINQLVDYLKGGASHAQSPISEEEIEKIRKSLSEYSKLPQSVKKKIEELFQQSKKDITKANELKRELDHWNIYKEYEDKFLDLFKKREDKSN